MRWATGRWSICWTAFGCQRSLYVRMRAPLRQVGGGTCVLRPTLAGAQRAVRKQSSSTLAWRAASQATANGACARRHHHRPASIYRGLPSRHSSSLWRGLRREAGIEPASRRHCAGSMPAQCLPSIESTCVPRKAVAGRRAQRICGAEQRRACGPRAQRASSSYSSRLSERRERSERSEFRDGAARPSSARDVARSATHEPQLSGARCPATALRAPISACGEPPPPQQGR